MILIKKVAVIICISIVLTSCFGNKKTAIGQEFNTDNFENKAFAGNKIDFKNLPEDLCPYINTDAVLTAFQPYSVTKVTIDEKKRFMGKNCSFNVVFNDDFSQYGIGFLSVTKDLNNAEQDWKESWEFRKKMKKSATYVTGLGKAAIWYGKQRKLEVKMDGYTISLTTPATYSKKDNAFLMEDYKKKAVAILKSSTLF